MRSDVRTFVDDIELKNVWKIFYVVVQKRMFELQKKFEKKSEKKKRSNCKKVREEKSSKRKSSNCKKVKKMIIKKNNDEAGLFIIEPNQKKFDLEKNKSEN